MSFFSKLLGVGAKSPRIPVLEVPAILAGCTESPVGETVAKLKLPPEVLELIPKTEDPAIVLPAMAKEPKLAVVTVKFLASLLKAPLALLWAVQAASLGLSKWKEQKPDSPPSPLEETALDAARAYQANPGPASLARVRECLQEARAAHCQGPGVWAAQAAEWKASDPLEGVDPSLLPEQPGLLAQAVAGTVLLAAAVAAPTFDPATLASASPSADAVPASAKDASSESGPPANADLLPEEGKPAAVALAPFIQQGLRLAGQAG